MNTTNPLVSNFNGKLLLAMNDNATPGYDVFPIELINEASWTTIPNQREEITAYRDDNTRNLHRTTAHGTKTKISFTTVDDLSEAEKHAIMLWLYNHYLGGNTTKVGSNPGETVTLDIARRQRRIKLKYWNDESEEYHTGVFYLSDVDYTIKKITKNGNKWDIRYSGISFTFVQY